MNKSCDKLLLLFLYRHGRTAEYFPLVKYGSEVYWHSPSCNYGYVIPYILILLHYLSVFSYCVLVWGHYVAVCVKWYADKPMLHHTA